MSYRTGKNIVTMRPRKAVGVKPKPLHKKSKEQKRRGKNTGRAQRAQERGYDPAAWWAL